ncbi:hypothetical protein [Nodularia sp. UHCC 0506]|uniref:hypothetical protein n=1 Tax=Nodularia sp. UHCC 0506 TaxID=3110243 RepID=UPI002B1F7CAB|nr:hypothetical protein [Nodularia sp. UHCC 0506]MEA5517024.1 hypothetical protein [Nodularia sp. UHCC 0506]
MNHYFLDLDELILLCRDKQAKILLKEAVDCYRSGAFRSCIISTWNAIVFDYLHKLRELKILCDAHAISELNHFESLINSNDYKGLWDFEDKIPKKARTTYEFISSVEEKDIIRLFEDRSRCAHPSVKSLEEPFEATAELARYHLRSAVIHFLQHPPIQGRKAFEQVKNNIISPNFPLEVNDAINYFRVSPLANARFGLIKDIIIDLTHYLLIENINDEEAKRLFCALNAIYSLYPSEVTAILNENLSKIIINKIPDEDLKKVITYITRFPNWDYLNSPCRVRLTYFINNLTISNSDDENLNILVEASQIDFFQNTVIEKIKNCIKETKEFLLICKKYQSLVFHEKIIYPLIEQYRLSANINQLIAMKSYANNQSNSLIDQTIVDKFDEYFDENELYSLVKLMFKYINKLPLNLFKLILSRKFEETTLDDLYNFINAKTFINHKLNMEDDEKSLEIIQLINEKLIEFSKIIFIDELTFDDLLQYFILWNETPNEIIKPILKKNTSAIIETFVKSNSFDKADSNSCYLLAVVEFINQEQWIYILENFLINEQIYLGHRCVERFCTIFEKCLKINNFEKNNWLEFQKKLIVLKHKFSNNIYIPKLIKCIDSHLILEQNN